MRLRTTDGLGHPAIVQNRSTATIDHSTTPVDWLIDNTPMREPLLWWADVCGVGRPFREAATWWR